MTTIEAAMRRPRELVAQRRRHDDACLRRIANHAHVEAALVIYAWTMSMHMSGHMFAFDSSTIHVE